MNTISTHSFNRAFRFVLILAFLGLFHCSRAQSTHDWQLKFEHALEITDLDSQKVYLESLINDLRKGEEEYILAKAVMLLGRNYEERNISTKAVEYYLLSLKLFKSLEVRDYWNESMAYKNIAYICKTNGVLDLSVIYYDSASMAFDKYFPVNNHGDSQERMHSDYFGILHQMGVVLHTSGRIEEYKQHLKRLDTMKIVGKVSNFQLRMLNSKAILATYESDHTLARRYYLSLLEHPKLDVKHKSFGLLNLGNNYKDLGEFDQAEKHYRLGIDHNLKNRLSTADSIGAKKSLTLLYRNLGEVLYYQGKYTMAIKALNKGLTVGFDMDGYPDIFDIHELLSKSHYSLGNSDFSATHQAIFNKYESELEMDSLAILSAREGEQIAAFLNAQIPSSDKRLERLLYFSIVIILILTGLIFYLKRISRKKKLVLFEKLEGILLKANND